MIREFLPSSFILYQPKDIVAGDFYWMEQILSKSQIIDSIEHNESTKDDQVTKPEIILFAACDCTRHGVPGAMVSVVCHNALNRAVREYGLTQPAAILDKTAQLVIENFSKSVEEIRDGMDISLCYYNTKTKTLQWAGANNPLWIVRKKTEGGDYELMETIADKQPIGEDQYNHPFTNHTFELKQDDTIYLFTDGYADQFSGEKIQKKLTRKRFKNLLLSFQHLPMEEQGKELERFIKGYRKEQEQIDDILVMGIRV